ncbi:hypothetical protein [uncultured Desulfobacter sp.]|uniref:hypothetical protein n=1 Tax=uncultured Desulfobacter sp. TaxID=240139 RepID=UPI0029F5297E|nr:hypothetical protein [uncultured Desulfobacter sp.]
MGLIPRTIAGKIRYAYQGIEAVKNQRGRNEITIRVRPAGEERISETAFENNVQPLIIMLCIPFGIIWAVAGHIIMGHSLFILSLFGIVAMAGVVSMTF